MGADGSVDEESLAGLVDSLSAIVTILMITVGLISESRRVFARRESSRLFAWWPAFTLAATAVQVWSISREMEALHSYGSSFETHWGCWSSVLCLVLIQGLRLVPRLTRRRR